MAKSTVANPRIRVGRGCKPSRLRAGAAKRARETKSERLSEARGVSEGWEDQVQVTESRRSISTRVLVETAKTLKRAVARVVTGWAVLGEVTRRGRGARGRPSRSDV
jgi:hypothetical protein